MDGMEFGTQFNFTYAPGVSPEQMLGFEMAGELWSQHLADNVTINIFVEMTDYLPENVIGSALPGIEDNVRYKDYRRKLNQDITSEVDTLINRNQQDETEKFTAYFSSQYDIDEGYKVDNNERIKMTRANAKALDLINPHDTGLDGYILMRDLDGFDDGDLNDIRWSYDYSSDIIDSNSLDFLSVAIHEIGHTLGFVSGLDQADWLSGKRYVNSGNEDDYYSDLVGNLDNATPLDMLRFSRASYDMSGDDENWIDMSLGGNPYLSFTGSGGSPVAYFATGENIELGGDGDQASHWKKQDNALGIMDPVLGLGQKRQITELDKQLFDAIGWDLKTGNLENTNLEAIHTEAKEVLVEKITAPADESGIDVDHNALTQWAATSSASITETIAEATKVIAPDYVNENNNSKDDRGEMLREMIKDSGDIYKWGWKGYWWGWKGYWWGWKGYWQSANDFNQDGFWQNLSWQSIDLSSNSESTNESLELDIADIFGESNILQSEFDVAEDSISDDFFKRDRLTIETESNDLEKENVVEDRSDVEETVLADSTTLDLNLLGSLLSEKLEDILKIDDELLVMPIN
ncbi:MAG TPA: NF038122 family metalloprotease [Xenococcaceae cyanobacterium]|jgi:hypothetical protein